MDFLIEDVCGLPLIPPALLSAVTGGPEGALGRELGIGCVVQAGTRAVATALGTLLTIWYFPVFVLTIS